MTMKGAYSKRAEILTLLRTSPGDWVDVGEMARTVYGRDDGYNRHALASLINLIRKEYGAERVETLLVRDAGRMKKTSAYRWLPEN